MILAIISAMSLKYHLLDGKGVLASIPIGYLVLTVGGPRHFIILLLFFGLSSIMTKIRVRKVGANFLEKDWVRGWKNVLANGLIPMIMISGYLFQPQHWSLITVGYLAAIGTAFADTLATEIGLLYPGKPRLITNLKEVARGTPGAISPYGYMGAFLSSLVVCISSIALDLIDLSMTPVIIIASIIGTTVDSLIGATIQAKYQCDTCGKLVENEYHCGRRCKKIGGVKIINTHMVNLFSTAIGGVLAILISIPLIS